MHLIRAVLALSFMSSWGSTWGVDVPGTNLPPGWAAADIGDVTKTGEVMYDAQNKSFRVRSGGEVTENRSTFGYVHVKGDFVATARVTAASKRTVGAGLMLRTGTHSGSRFIKNAFNGFDFGNGPVVTFRSADDVGTHAPGDVSYPQALPCWVRLIRYHDSVASYYSADGKEWNLMHFGGVRFSPGLPDDVLVGVASSTHDSNELEEATIDQVTITQPVQLPYVTSWLGNSFASNYYAGHVQMQITAMCIDRSGKQPRLRIVGMNEGLDSSVYDLDGNLLWMYQLEKGGGGVIAAEGGRIIEATGGNWNGTTQLEWLDPTNAHPHPSNPKRQFASLRPQHHITGVGIQGGKVYVSETNEEKVFVLDAESLAEITTFKVSRPGRMVLDGKGGMWLVQRAGTAVSKTYVDKTDTTPPIYGTALDNPVDVLPPDHLPAAQINYFTLDGKRVVERTITFAALGADGVNAVKAVEPGQMAVHPKTGHVYVCDAGPNQCVWIFDGQGKPVGHFGALGGVYQAKIPGTVDAEHLYFPRAITFDDAGCLYLAMCPRVGWVGGAVLRKYAATGKQILWERHGMEFQEAADGDPGTDYTDVFTQTHHYKMDFSKGPGKEASYQALTFDPFTYPEDKRNTTNGGGVNATVVRRIAGKRVLFLHHWARHGEQIYRFAEGSEIAIPCASVTNDGIWIDLNGNAKRDAGETGPKLDKAWGSSWTVDANGDIWSAGNLSVQCWRNQGLSVHGVPLFTQEPTEVYAKPDGLVSLSHALYDAALDRLFIGGFTAARPKDSADHGGGMGSVLMGFAGVRTTKALSKLLWQRDIPYEAGGKGLGNETNNFFCGSYAGDAKGGYLFIGGLSERGVRKISVWAIDPTTGKQVETFLPGPEVAGYCGWFDFNNCINAMKRADGEYIIYEEDDGAQKVNFFRWRPGTATAPKR